MESNEIMCNVERWLDNQAVNSIGICLDGLNTTGNTHISGGSSVLTGSAATQEREIGKELSLITDIDELAEKLVSSPANFVTTVMGIAQSRSGWKPLEPESADNAENFKKYIDQIMKFPLMIVTKTDTTTVTYSEGNYDSLIDNIADIYSGMSDGDKNSVKAGLTSLARSCMSRVNEKQKKVLFTQSTMCVNDEVTTSFYSSNVAMEKKHSSGKNAPADEFSSEVQVSRVEVKFNRMALNKNIAKKLCSLLFKSIDDWLEETNTKQTDKKIEFCFGD